jgi:pyridoxamine 5'-phosphate oxidase
MTDDSHHPDNLTDILAQCWQLLARGVTDRRFGFHHPVVSNVDLSAKPRARVVILRSAEKGALRFHTDIRSQKWQELLARPAVSVVFYDEQEKVQLRVDGEAKLHHGDDLARQAWIGSQRMSRVAYGSLPGPGVEIADYDDFTLPPADDDVALAVGETHFAAVVIHVQAMEWLYLKARNNRRALFDLRTQKAKWLVP